MFTRVNINQTIISNVCTVMYVQKVNRIHTEKIFFSKILIFRKETLISSLLTKNKIIVYFLKLFYLGRCNN